MDQMNCSSLQSISICELNTKFNDRCHADWSKSNLISLVTLEGIYIMKPQLDIAHGPFQIELIRNPCTKFRHLGEVCDNLPRFDKMWHNLDKQQYLETFLDPSLMTNIETLSLDMYPRRYRLARWSPLMNVYPRQCLLAVITIDHQLLIFGYMFHTWLILCDVSHEFDKISTHLINMTQDQKDDYDSTRKSLHSLSFCNVCWKEADKGNPMLLAATIPGDIVVWQIAIQNEVLTSDTKLEIKMILRTNLEYINSMNLFKNLLIVSAQDGQVVLYDLAINFGQLETASPTQSGDVSDNIDANTIKTLNLILLQPTATLWHRDYIEVTDFYLQPISQDTFRIVLAKSTNICWCIINYTKAADNEYATLAISDSFSAIDGSDPDVSLHQTPATWLRPAGDRKAVLIADDGSFFQLEFVDDCHDASPEFSAIRTGKVDLSRMIPRGLCASPHGVLIAMVSSISLIYEPTKILSPTKVVLLPLVNNMKHFNDSIANLLNEEWLAKESIESPMDVCDTIDYIRSIYPSLNPDQYLGLHKTLKENIIAIALPKNQAQLIKLKIATFLFMKLTQDKESQKMIENHPDNYLCSTARQNILLYFIQDVLSTKLIDLTKDNLNSFDTEQLKSLKNYSKWLDLCEERKDLKHKTYMHQFKLIEMTDVSSNEICVICQAEILFVSADYGCCSNQHRFERCARSLLILDMNSGDKLACEHCGRCYLNYRVWSMRNLWLCTYCQ